MKCPACGCPDLKVIDSRPIEEGNSIRRRRECLQCAKRFTTFEMIELRNEMLGIVPARTDVAQKVGGLSVVINENLEKGNIVIMPSIKENAQMWTPLQTVFTDLAKDPYRKKSEMKYDSLQAIKEALQKVDKQIYDAIFTLQG